MIAPATESRKSEYLPLSAMSPRVARAADDLARVAVTLAHEAAVRGNGALAADALRARQLATATARLAVVVDGDVGELLKPPPRCTCPGCAPWGDSPWVDLRDVPPAVRRG